MLGPKPSALPLGDDPICYILALKMIFHNKIGANGGALAMIRTLESRGVVSKLEGNFEIRLRNNAWRNSDMVLR